jgi:hypothetical protein
MKLPIVLAAAAAALIGCSSGPAGGSASNVPLGERVSLDGLSYQPPTTWSSEKPSSGMRMAQYRIAPSSGDSDAGECALFHFPGQGGSVEANIDRWVGQFQQPDGSPSKDHASTETFTANGLNVTYVDVTGTYSGGMSMTAPSQPKPGYRMVAGVIETSQGPWFMKCTGPAATMEATAPGLKAMLRSARG